jgi:hypothetical protein
VSLDAEHPLEFALVHGIAGTRGEYRTVQPSDGLSDAEVFGKLAADGADHLGRPVSRLGRIQLEHHAAYTAELRVTRTARCPSCEEPAPCEARRLASAGQ